MSELMERNNGGCLIWTIRNGLTLVVVLWLIFFTKKIGLSEGGAAAGEIESEKERLFSGEITGNLD